VRPDEHSSTKTLHHLTVKIKLQHGVQIRIKTLISKTFRCGCITPDHRPNILTAGLNRDTPNGAHLPSIRQFRPPVNGTVRIWERLPSQFTFRSSPRENGEQDHAYNSACLQHNHTSLEKTDSIRKMRIFFTFTNHSNR
jgi:hypothetical protein